MDKYTIIIEKMDTGEWFIKIKECPGCMSEGETELEALKNILEAKELWLKAVKEDGYISEEVF